MHSARYARWKIEAIAAALFAIAAAVTAVAPQWMEALGFDPDHGSGAAEWAIVAVFGVRSWCSPWPPRFTSAGSARSRWLAP